MERMSDCVSMLRREKSILSMVSGDVTSCSDDCGNVLLECSKIGDAFRIWVLIKTNIR